MSNQINARIRTKGHGILRPAINLCIKITGKNCLRVLKDNVGEYAGEFDDFVLVAKGFYAGINIGIDIKVVRHCVENKKKILLYMKNERNLGHEYWYILSDVKGAADVSTREVINTQTRIQISKSMFVELPLKSDWCIGSSYKMPSREDVFKRDGYKCVRCRMIKGSSLTREEHLEKYGQDLHFGHIISKTYLEPTCDKYYITLCKECNNLQNILSLPIDIIEQLGVINYPLPNIEPKTESPPPPMPTPILTPIPQVPINNTTPPPPAQMSLF